MVEAPRQFSALSEEFVELSFRHDPVEATRVGIHDYDRILPDDSRDGVQSRLAWLKDFEHRLDQVPETALPTTQRVDHAYLRSRVATLRGEIEMLRVPARNPARYPERALHGVFLLLARPFAPLEERKEAILDRLIAIPDYLEAATKNLEPVPAVIVDTALEVTRSGPGFVEHVARTMRKSFPGEDERIEFAAQRARLGFLRYQEHLERELLPRAAGSFAIGESAMNTLLHQKHLLGMNCTEIESLGLEHVARARGLLEAEALRLDSARDWRQQIAAARLRHPDRGELREVYVAETARALEFVREKRVAPVVGTALEIVDTPLYMRALTPYAAYLPSAPFDPDQTGYFFLTPVDVGASKEFQEEQLQANGWARLPLVVLHEAYPGRHLQTGHANQAVTRIRQLAYNDLFAEGWALYCAELMHEHGYFPEPVTRLFQLRDLLWRACRVVLDIRLQCGRMTSEEAVDFLVEQVLMERAAARSEVRRYLLSPTQPLSYLVGMLEIVSMREEAKTRMGSAFDLHDFHAALLGVGALPPALVREELWERLGLSEAGSRG
jgi:uncharacterized protein (DUF885 family)